MMELDISLHEDTACPKCGCECLFYEDLNDLKNKKINEDELYSIQCAGCDCIFYAQAKIIDKQNVELTPTGDIKFSGDVINTEEEE